MFGLAASGHDQFVEQSGGLIGVPRPTWPCRQRLAGELVDDVEETQLAAVDGEVVLVVQRPHVIGAGRRHAPVRRTVAQAQPLAGLRRTLQPFVFPQSVRAFGIDHEAF
ncbi:hypothetical protein CKJ64_03635 [Mycobacterium avium]|nr:hypothetical protein CKJ64_03635 [Mycobacterium avium]